MKCPIDGETLVITDRNGIEIDYCPLCRGVWLDRGELDKIIERSAQPYAFDRGQEARDRGQDAGEYEGTHRRGDHKRRKGGLLSEIFDFLD